RAACEAAEAPELAVRDAERLRETQRIRLRERFDRLEAGRRELEAELGIETVEPAGDEACPVDRRCRRRFLHGRRRGEGELADRARELRSELVLRSGARLDGQRTGFD